MSNLIEQELSALAGTHKSSALSAAFLTQRIAVLSGELLDMHNNKGVGKTMRKLSELIAKELGISHSSAQGIAEHGIRKCALIFMAKMQNVKGE